MRKKDMGLSGDIVPSVVDGNSRRGSLLVNAQEPLECTAVKMAGDDENPNTYQKENEDIHLFLRILSPCVVSQDTYLKKLDNFAFEKVGYNFCIDRIAELKKVKEHEQRFGKFLHKANQIGFQPANRNIYF